MRQGNLLNLRWGQINLSARKIFLPAMKTYPVGIPICDTLLNLLQSLDAGRKDKNPESFVFSNSKGRPYYKMVVTRHFKKALKDAEISSFRWHDLRHDFGSNLAQNGVDVLKIKELMGHRDIRMTLRYAHLRPVDIAAGVGALDKPRYHSATIKGGEG